MKMEVDEQPDATVDAVNLSGGKTQNELPQFLVDVEMSWVGFLFRRVWADDKMPLLEKLTLLDEASKAWPFATRIEYHKWRYQFKDEDETLKLFDNEPEVIKSIIVALHKQHKGNLEVFAKLLWSIRSGMSDQLGLCKWMMSELQRPPFEALYFAGSLPKQVIFKLEWCTEKRPSERVPFEIKVDLCTNLALEIFLRLCCGDNQYDMGKRPFEFVGQKLHSNPHGFSCIFKNVKFPSSSATKMLTRMEARPYGSKEKLVFLRMQCKDPNNPNNQANQLGVFFRNKVRFLRE
ncbi:hypothetical protein WR25_05971 isoform B [Diploscapter pachys]|uniref:Uncharacterized protein n=2 Tax=Diploscapter pachys TaxID=2018661 RepID=A0A2A2LQR5_9BILA|nr:hypothetical protein WR25_05971 isoform B [Diploscapter pachys]